MLWEVLKAKTTKKQMLIDQINFFEDTAPKVPTDFHCRLEWELIFKRTTVFEKSDLKLWGPNVG